MLRPYTFVTLFKPRILVQNQTLHDVPSQWFFDGKDEVLIDALAVNDNSERGSYSLASGSGCSGFYNAAVQGEENTEMKLFFEEDRFEFVALRDKEKAEELSVEYKSLNALRDTETGPPSPPDRQSTTEVLLS